jgi:hypothetical protein
VANTVQKRELELWAMLLIACLPVGNGGKRSTLSSSLIHATDYWGIAQ